MIRFVPSNASEMINKARKPPHETQEPKSKVAEVVDPTAGLLNWAALLSWPVVLLSWVVHSELSVTIPRAQASEKVKHSKIPPAWLVMRTSLHASGILPEEVVLVPGSLVGGSPPPRTFITGTIQRYGPK